MRLTILFSLLLLGFLSFAQNTNPFINDYLKKWKNSEKYLLDIIQAMPEDKMDFSPTEKAKNFEDIILHMVGNMVWLTSDYLGGEGFKEYKDKTFTKSELMELVSQAFSYSYKALENIKEDQFYQENEFFAGPMTTMQIMTLLNDHLTHHRGALTIYLNLNNVNVPKYIGW